MSPKHITTAPIPHRHLPATRKLLVAGLCIAVLTSGCRRDEIESLSLDAGNAIAVNKAVHTIDPWPPGAFRRHQTTNGRRMADAYERYQAKPPPPAAPKKN